MIINKIQEFCIHLFLINHLVVYRKHFQKIISFLKKFDSEFQEIEVWFTDQSSQSSGREDKMNLTLIIR